MTVGCAVGPLLGFRIPWKTAGGAVTLALVGFADDRWSVPVAPRLVSQFGVGAATDISGQHLPLGLITVPVAVNVVNFMDGINAITSLTTVVWGLNAAFTGLLTDNDHVVLLGTALGGAVLGFLPHNVRRERMFLGDVGSYLIGATIALTGLHPSLSLRSRIVLMTPMVPYLLDTGTTVIKRAFRGDDITEAHREHLYQRLANERRWGHLPVALAYAAAAALCACVATAALVRRTP